MRRFLLLGLLLTSSVAFAQSHVIDFSTVITDQDNQQLFECTDPTNVEANNSARKQKRPLTLGTIALRSLAQPEQGIAPEESLRRGQLGLNVYQSHGAKLTVEEIALIKRQVAKAYNPLIVAKTFQILDPATTGGGDGK